MPAGRRTLVGLHLSNALSAVGGGIALVAGGPGVPATLLRHTPFDSCVVASIRLFQATAPASEPRTVVPAREDQEVLR